MRILAIETSFDDTCVALLNNDKVMLNLQSSYPNLGLDPIAGSAFHFEQLPKLLKEIPEYDIISCTRGPGQALCLKQGWILANQLSKKLNKPLIGIHHMEAHCLSPMINNPNLKFPYLCFIGSGGHTQLVKVHSALNFELLSNCLDDAIGEAYDKTSRLFGVSTKDMCHRIYKRTTKIKIPQIMRNDKTGNFSFSGLKSAIRRFKELSLYEDEALMIAFQQSALNHINRQIQTILAKTKVTAISAAGGAIMNPAIQDLLNLVGKNYKLPVFIPNAEYLTDNAAMIGFCAWLQINENRPYDELNNWYFDKWDYNRVQQPQINDI